MPFSTGGRALRVMLLQSRPVGYHLTGQGAAPPLGLLSIASAARERLPGRLVFELIDSYFYSNAEIEEKIGMFRPDLAAISGITASHDRMKALTALVRRCGGSEMKVILGGPHATAYPDQCLCFGADALVKGEGEIPFSDYLEHLAGERPLPSVRGILRPGHPVPVRNPHAPRIMKIDNLPPPAYDLMDISLYEAVPNDMATIMLPPHRYLPLFTSRGCPFRCTFCHTIFGKRFRAQGIERVLAEISELMARYEVRDFHFYDDIFNADPRRVYELCEGIAKRRLDLKLYFSNGLRADTLDRSQLEAMREAGVVYFGAAIESASNRMQQLIGKRMDVEKLLENVAIADELGIFTTGFLMMGFPGETRQEMELTIETARKSALHYAYFSVLNPYSGTVIGRKQRAEGIELSPEDLPSGYSCFGWNVAGIPEKEFQEIVVSAYRAFWTPKRFCAFLSRHPDPRAFFLGVFSPRTRKNLLSRVGGVLGRKTQEPSDDAGWQMPAPAGPLENMLARLMARAACRAVSLIHSPPRT